MTHPTTARVNEVNARIAVIVSGVMVSATDEKRTMLSQAAEPVQKTIFQGLVDLIDSGVTFEKWHALFLSANMSSDYMEKFGVQEMLDLRDEVVALDLKPYYDDVIVPMVDNKEEVDAIRQMNDFFQR